MTATPFQAISLPPPVLYPPFNITRASHYSLSVSDLEVSLRFYCGVIGLMLTERVGDTAYLRGAEESCHHSLILRQTMGLAECGAIGFCVLTEAELDKAYDWAVAQGLSPQWLDVPF
jgi:catechol 2,3-dioxygenase